MLREIACPATSPSLQEIRCLHHGLLGVCGKSYISNCARMIFAIIATGVSQTGRLRLDAGNQPHERCERKARTKRKRSRRNGMFSNQ